MPPPSPIESFLRANRGKKRSRAFIIVSVLVITYVAHVAPNELFTHWYDLLGLFGLGVLVDYAQEEYNALVYPRFPPDPVPQITHEPCEACGHTKGTTK